MKLLSATIWPALSSAALLSVLALNLSGCDSRETMQPPRTEARTMIIGGVPVSEHDYKLPREEMAYNEAVTQDDVY